MATVESMLDEAKRGVSNVLYCLEEKAEPDTVLASAWAAYAQAAAATAQAMILASATSAGTDYNGNDMLVFRTEVLR